jgi:hypothetical protein
VQPSTPTAQELPQVPSQHSPKASGQQTQVPSQLPLPQNCTLDECTDTSKKPDADISDIFGIPSPTTAVNSAKIYSAAIAFFAILGL